MLVLGIIVCISGFAQIILSFFKPFKQYKEFMNIGTGTAAIMMGAMLISEGLSH